MKTTPTRAPLQALALLMAALLAFTVAAPASAQTTGDALDLDGTTNVARAVAWSQVAYTPADAAPATPPAGALIGRADEFADNLAAGSLMGAAVAAGRPLLLTASGQLDADTLAELQRVLPDGGDVTILGGEIAIEPSVRTELEAAGYTVDRLAGETRTETAIDIAQETDSDTVLVVRSSAAGTDPTQAFADSLAAGALAATNGWEILFTQTGELNPNTADELSTAGYATAYVVGGDAAISPETFDAIDEIVPTTTRVAGETRFDTAVQLNELREGALGDLTIVVDGQGADAWADGFPAANLSGSANYPVVLTNGDGVPAPTAAYLEGRRPVEASGGTFADHLDGVLLICGPTATDTACAAALETLNGNADGVIRPFPAPAVDAPMVNDVFTAAPELLRAEQVGDAGEGTYRFTFDEEVDAASLNAGCFHLYRFDQQPPAEPDTQGAADDCTGDDGGHAEDVNVNPASLDGRSAEIDADDPASVIVTFSVDPDEAALLALATVDWKAVVDADDVPNLEGGYPLQEVALAGGVTLNPALESVDGFDVADNTVAFTFDRDLSTTVADTDGFRLILASGDVLVSDDATIDAAMPTTVTAEFSSPDNDALVDPAGTDAGTIVEATSGDLVRAAATEDAVTEADGSRTNDLSVLLVAAGGITEDPDLIAITPVADGDTLEYTFDTEVTISSAGPCAAGDLGPLESTPEACFSVEDVDGTDTSATAVTPKEGDATTVVATFEDGVLDAAVAAAVQDAAVTDADAAARANAVGRIGFPDRTVEVGTTLAPDLLSVEEITTADDARLLVFTFDSEVVASTEALPVPGLEGATLPDASRFFAYDAEGAATRATSAEVDEDDATRVLVSFGADTATVLDAAVAATVNDGAVADADGQVNPEGLRGLGVADPA